MVAGGLVPPRLARLIAVALLATGCSGGDTDDVAGCREVDTGTERIELGDRWYDRTVPDDLPDGRPPLVVDLHGYSEGAELHAEVTGFGPLGEDEGFVTVTPEGSGEPAHWDLGDDERDVEFVEAVIDDVVGDVCVDDARVFVTGSSNGGYFTTRLACELGDRLAAVATVAGVGDVDACAQWEPVPVLVIHGTEDDAVLYDGGLHPRVADALQLPESGPSVPELTARWAARNGCDDQPLTTRDDGAITGFTWSCPRGAQVALHQVHHTGHEWPDHATQAIWDFFDAVS